MDHVDAEDEAEGGAALHQGLGRGGGVQLHEWKDVFQARAGN